jgi:NADH-quinone oxidoreductase subunit L
MTDLVKYVWIIPLLPLVAAGLSALAPRSARGFSSSLAVGSMAIAFLLSCAALVATLDGHQTAPLVHNFDWFVLGETTVKLGWVLDPLSASMLVMITFVGALIFIFSVGYMAHDANFTRFFCFLSLFAAAMLGLVIANNLLLLFMCWEVVGLASYLLIGFWFHKPSAAAAAKKAFITTRIGDVFFFLGLLWLNAETGTLLFYAEGAGCLEQSAISNLVGQVTMTGMGVSTAISLLIFCGAIGKSGQVPLHVWLPDAMEGPTPVSALIHAATMVAAGVFLVARVYPLMAATSVPVAGTPTPMVAAQRTTAMQPAYAEIRAGESNPATAVATNQAKAGADGEKKDNVAPVAPRTSFALQVVTWIGAITALFAALIAVGQTDIKRILAYSTVSQLGFMFIGLGVGGVAVGMFHLLTHAFFKALLFLGSGSVIHGCHEEQDIRRMGGLRRLMPVTFATYAIGMMALAGVPPLAGFWSKDEILHSAALWEPSKWPFFLGLCGAFLTAFYMTRQMWYVFFGASRAADLHPHAAVESKPSDETAHLHYESPPVMTMPLAILAACTVILGCFGTPVWPWFHSYLSGHGVPGSLAPVELGTLMVMVVSAIIAVAGIAVGWSLYSRKGPQQADEPDPLERLRPDWFALLRDKFYIDELYEMSVVRFNAWASRTARWLDERVWSTVVQGVSILVVGVSWVNRLFDEYVVNPGFDQSCGGVRNSARWLSFWQNGQVQRYLRVIALGLVIFGIIFIWGGRR